MVATQDWHPERTAHFVTDGGPWPVHCVGGTWGAAFHPALELPETAPRVRKGAAGEDGYSGFTMRDPRTGETIVDRAGVPPAVGGRRDRRRRRPGDRLLRQGDRTRRGAPRVRYDGPQATQWPRSTCSRATAIGRSTSFERPGSSFGGRWRDPRSPAHRDRRRGDGLARRSLARVARNRGQPPEPIRSVRRGRRPDRGGLARAGRRRRPASLDARHEGRADPDRRRHGRRHPGRSRRPHLRDGRRRPDRDHGLRAAPALRDPSRGNVQRRGPDRAGTGRRRQHHDRALGRDPRPALPAAPLGDCSCGRSWRGSSRPTSSASARWSNPDLAGA